MTKKNNKLDDFQYNVHSVTYHVYVPIHQISWVIRQERGS